MKQRRSARRLIWLAMALLPGSSVAAEQWGGLVTLTTDYIFKGLSQSDGKAAVQADLHMRTAGGWSLGAWATTADPTPGNVANYEVDLYLGRTWDISDRWTASMTYVRYLYPDSSPAGRYDSDEFSASMQYEDRATFTISYAPDSRPYSAYGYVYHGHMLSYEASLRQSLPARLALLASLGYYDTDDIFRRSYWAGDIGVAVKAGQFDFSVMRFVTNSTARDLFGHSTADGRWVATATWRF